MKYIIGTLVCALALITPVAWVVNKIHFNQDCSGYLKQTADANTAEREGGTSLTIPQGISRYPNNAAWMIFGWLSALLFIGSASWMFYKWQDEL